MSDRWKQVRELAYHRNGISGEGFYVGRIYDTIEDRWFVAIVPSWASENNAKSPVGGVPCYVIDPDTASGPDGTVAFGQNSWRGDHYYDEMVAAIAAYEQRLDERLGITDIHRRARRNDPASADPRTSGTP